MVNVAVVALVVVSIARLCLALVDVVIRIVMVAGTPGVAAEYGSAIETNDSIFWDALLITPRWGLYGR